MVRNFGAESAYLVCSLGTRWLEYWGKYCIFTLLLQYRKMVRNFGAKIAFFTLKIEYRMVKNLGAKNALFQVSLYKGRPLAAFIMFCPLGRLRSHPSINCKQ